MEIYKDNLFVEMYSKHEGHLHGFKEIVLTGKTDFQQVEIVDTHEYGRCLLLDGKMQSSQADEFVYHEYLVHPAMIVHPMPKDILIIGGGEGATLREVLRYKTVEQCDMVEIDGEVIGFAKEHLFEWHQGAFDDHRTNLIVGDGRKYVEETSKKYDVIIIDISDPGSEGPAYLLYTHTFYSMVKEKLKTNGMIVLQAGTSSVVQGNIMACIYCTLMSVFKSVNAFEAAIPSFDLPWGFCMASDYMNPKNYNATEIDKRMAERDLTDLKAFDGETFIGLLHTTKALRHVLTTQGRLIDDNEPVYTPL